LYACLSPAAQSTDGALYRSEDFGESWQRFDHGVKAEATMMGVALHPRDHDQVYGRRAVWSGLWHARRRPQLAGVSVAAGLRRHLRDRLRLTDEANLRRRASDDAFALPKAAVPVQGWSGCGIQHHVGGLFTNHD
jgi:hypothetical protein